ncbi:metallophosphoesterase family protein [Planctomicrobium sp.]|jgi:predicted phosphodiesterase|nr:metallophosphoesterase family protein [Planctomicrobium sp.]MDA7503719.1 metallophosphoesterase family protein [bacterium]MBT5018019.1 metallophosphoesterase [Planctomicrobium sp.]MDA7527773.1 metallophosphoesterase family protein [bacterium]MDB4743856.1 metallophosphoesterase family protein [Planctomicrobium sp.]MDB4802352.1 metallophosphoesterase family protein [bacterium]
MKFAFFGGIYNNYLALESAIKDSQKRGVEQLYCLGDIGAFGPHPDRVFPLLNQHQVQVVQGNYDNSIGNDLNDCQCGYTDPKDNHFAQISYEYTYEKTSSQNRAWLKELPTEIRFELMGKRFLLCHGSPRKTNEFLWESTTSTHFLKKQADDFGADIILGTHTGLHWKRNLSEGQQYINVGVLGRPENDGTKNVWYTLVTIEQDRVDVEFIPLEYDHQRLAKEMQSEKLPEEFVETILTGWWTTCLEVLPGRERRVGKF